jgi:hypothetical protein
MSQTTRRTATIGREVVQRGPYSCYLSISQDWIQESGLSVDGTARLERLEQGDRSVTVRLHIDQDYSTVEDPPGRFDVKFVDIQTAIQFSIPAGLRKLHGIDGDFIYNSEFDRDQSVVDYELVSPNGRDVLRLK